MKGTNEKKWITIPGLYRLYLRINNFHSRNVVFDVVHMVIYRHGGTVPFNPEDYLPVGFLDKIKDDDENEHPTRKELVYDHLKEHFLPSEIEQMKQFLKNYRDTEIKKEEECSMPEDGTIMPTGFIPLGGGQDSYCFYKEKDYNLPFEIAGYYDLRNSKIHKVEKEDK